MLCVILYSPVFLTKIYHKFKDILYFYYIKYPYIFYSIVFRDDTISIFFILNINNKFMIILIPHVKKIDTIHEMDEISKIISTLSPIVLRITYNSPIPNGIPIIKPIITNTIV